MKWSSSLQQSPSFEKAVAAAVADVRKGLRSGAPDLGLLFVSAAFRSNLVDLWSVLRKELGVRHLIGCTGGGVIGAGREAEDDAAAVSFTGALLPGVDITPFVVQQERLPDLDAGPKSWRDLIGVDPGTKPDFLILSDPFSVDSDALLAGLDFAYPGAVKIGGLASGGVRPNENLLLCDERIVSKGAVGVALSGDIRVDAIVAQGCRPIGEPLTITQAKENVLISVNDKPPLVYLQELFESLSDHDQLLLQTSLFLGIAMNAFKAEPKQGDFLIRNLIGLDQASGALAIGAPLRVGQKVQFHLRDAETSREDLRFMLSRSGLRDLKEKKRNNRNQAGAVLFSCLGRGHRLYGEPDHDSALIKSMVGEIPIGGFFCNGEIGPVEGRTYLHGYTSSIALISPAQR